MQRLSITKANAFILVFSISSKQSLEELKVILELINEVSIRIILRSVFLSNKMPKNVEIISIFE